MPVNSGLALHLKFMIELGKVELESTDHLSQYTLSLSDTFATNALKRTLIVPMIPSLVTVFALKRSSLRMLHADTE